MNGTIFDQPNTWIGWVRRKFTYRIIMRDHKTLDGTNCPRKPRTKIRHEPKCRAKLSKIIDKLYRLFHQQNIGVCRAYFGRLFRAGLFAGWIRQRYNTRMSQFAMIQEK